MGDIQEDEGGSEIKFQNADITVSESKAILEGKAVWELKNWNDPENFNLLKQHANCVVPIGEDFFLRFFFKKERTSLNMELSTRTDYDGLSLYVSPLTTGGNLHEYGLAVKVAVDYLNENLEVGEVPQHHKIVPEKTLSFEGGERSPTEMMVLKDFILLSKSWHFRCSNGPTTETYERPENLRYGITVQFLQCNEASSFIPGKGASSKDVTSGEVSSQRENPVELSIAKDFECMFAQEDNYADLKIESKDGMVISAHKFVLAARSPKLRDLIDEELKNEDFSGKIKLPDLDFKPLNIVLTWMYTGKLDDDGIQADNLEDVIIAAENYGLEQLLKQCEQKVIGVCNIMNMLNLFQLAQKYGMVAAMRKISLFIKENIEEVATPTLV